MKQIDLSISQKSKVVYCVSDIKEILKISKTSAYKLCKQDLFKTVRIGKSIRINKESFDKWFDENFKD